jgi:hypothetical protein
MLLLQLLDGSNVVSVNLPAAEVGGCGAGGMGHTVSYTEGILSGG